MNFIHSFCVHINRSTKFQTHRRDSEWNQYAWQNSYQTPCTKQSLTPRNNTFLEDPWQFKISAPWLQMSGTIHSLTHEISFVLLSYGRKRIYPYIYTSNNPYETWCSRKWNVKVQYLTHIKTQTQKPKLLLYDMICLLTVIRLSPSGR
jgi:hypothetical protein